MVLVSYFMQAAALFLIVSACLMLAYVPHAELIAGGVIQPILIPINAGLFVAQFIIRRHLKKGQRP